MGEVASRKSNKTSSEIRPVEMFGLDANNNLQSIMVDDHGRIMAISDPNELQTVDSTGDTTIFSGAGRLVSLIVNEVSSAVLTVKDGTNTLFSIDLSIVNQPIAYDKLITEGLNVSVSGIIAPNITILYKES